MPDNPSSSSSETAPDFSQDIELADHYAEPEYSSVLSAMQQLGVQGAQRYLKPFGSGFLAANAMYGLLTTVLEGYPNLVPQMRRILAEYQIPAIAATYVTLGALNAVEVKEVKEANRVALSLMDGLGATAFSLPMTMEIVTRFVQLIEAEPRSSDVQIPNWAAGIIVTFCGVLGVIQSLQTDYLKTNAADPEREQSIINRIVTHPSMLTAAAVMKSAASIHGVTMAFMDIAQVNTQANLEYYLRWGITLAAGVIGGYVLGRPNPEERYDAIIMNRTLTAAQLFTLCLAFVGTFYLSPDAEKVYGDVIQEQTVLWAAIIPVLVTAINLFHYLWVASPDLIAKFSVILPDSPSSIDEERALNVQSDICYGTTTFVSDSSDSEPYSSLSDIEFSLSSASDSDGSTRESSCEQNESSSDDVSSQFGEEESSYNYEQAGSALKDDEKCASISYARLIDASSPIFRATASMAPLEEVIYRNRFYTQ
ncbi:hypothetical protein [Legionella worsleiensis]|uniref:Uncharacterized protein n=1 Tax=Legionella worsleiensis TaxID=45076 RepID=A0A0W1AL56_9GAMM|nr:hypothetical protein [Legionella worsleiensis]KTD82090.1 hypothetical protein Lwor_0010 [Legionella worsleiensis]STY31485.1 Uncharacterised protein [Legionella worsleiensis]